MNTETTIELLKSPTWWLTVVIAGICINLISSYLRNILDSRLSKISEWWQHRSEKKLNEEKNTLID